MLLNSMGNERENQRQTATRINFWPKKEKKARVDEEIAEILNGHK